jgi:hypothetical protein
LALAAPPVLSAFFAAADCARGANPLAALGEPGTRAAADCTLAAAFPVIGAAFPVLFPPLFLAIPCLPRSWIRPAVYTPGIAQQLTW